MLIRPYQDKEVLITASLGLMFLASLATIFWGADKCLGLGDEGFYFLSARYPDEYQKNVTSAFFYTGFLFRMASFDPMGFRLLGVLTICFSAFIFWVGFYKFLAKSYPVIKTQKYFRVTSLFFIQLGALLNYQWFYMTPNYNTLVGISISISAGSVLWGFAQIENWQRNIKSIILAFVFCGLGIGLAFFTKFPTAICFIFIYFLVIFLWNGIQRYQKITLVAAVLTGMALWFLGHFLFVQPPHIWWQAFKEGWGLYQALEVYSPQSKLIAYARDMAFFIYSAIKIYWPCYLIIGTVYPFYIFRKGAREVSGTLNSLMVFIVMLVAVILSVKSGIFIDDRKTNDGSIPFYLVFPFAWILLLLTLWITSSWYKSRRGSASPPNSNMNIKIVLGLLIALPIAGSVGTSNPLYNVPLCFAATWFGAILLIHTVSTVSERNSYWLRLLCLLSIGAFTTSQIIQGYIYDPQLDPQLNFKTDLLQQVEATEVGFPVKFLKLDMQTHQLVQYLSFTAKANGFQPGGDIIAIGDIPGLVFAMGGISPGHPTFIGGSKDAEDFSLLALKLSNIKRLRNAFVLLDVDPAYAKFILERRDLNFPSEYVKIGAIVSRGVQFSLWKPENTF